MAGDAQVVDVSGLFQERSQMSTIQSSAINLQRTIPLRDSRGVITTIKKRRDDSSDSRAHLLNATFQTSQHVEAERANEVGLAPLRKKPMSLEQI